MQMILVAVIQIAIQLIAGRECRAVGCVSGLLQLGLGIIPIHRQMLLVGSVLGVRHPSTGKYRRF